MEERQDLRMSATTLYYQQRVHSARSAGTARVPVGPPTKLVGGQLVSAYERPSGPATSASPATNGSPAASTGPTQAWGDATSSSANTSSTSGSSPYATKKVVYWTGRDHHIVDAPAHVNAAFKWTPPHLKQTDVEPGAQLGVRETPGACRIKLIGSKYRYLPTMEPAPVGTSMWAVSPEEAAKYGSVGSNTLGSNGNWNATGTGLKPRPHTAFASPYSGSLSAYAARQGVVGYKDYEQTCRTLNGLGSWERTQKRLMSSSMDIGRPSTLMSPGAHTMRVNASFSGLPRA